MQVTVQQFNKYFNHVVTFFLTLLIFGIPLAFTSLTRSVFEVNKLFVLRLILVILYLLWFAKYLLFKDNGQDNPKEQSYSIFGFRWKRIGLEIPVLAWIFINYISSFFSENIYISYIGSYDRWEGISMILNYVCLIYMVAKLVNNFPQRYWIIGMTIFSTFISAFYGILQSLGFDFMNWNADPSMRVFACINNPVHFCAYVAMLVPLGISLAQRMIEYKSTVITSLKGIHLKHIRLFAVLISVVSSLFFTFKTTAFTIDYAVSIVTFFLFLGAGIVTLRPYKTLIPTFRTVMSLGVLVVVFFAVSLTNQFHLDPFQFLALLCCLAVYFIMNVNYDLKLFLYRTTFIISISLFYAMILSYSRATLVGFSIGMAFYFCHFILSDKKPAFKTELIDIIQQFLGLFLINLAFIFKLFLHSPTTQIVFGFFFFCSHLLFLNLSSKKAFNSSTYLTSLFVFSLIALNFIDLHKIFSLSFFETYRSLFMLVSLILFYMLSQFINKKTLTIIVISFILMGISFFNYNLINFFYLFSLVLFLYKQLLPQFNHISSEMRFNIIITLLFMLLITLIPQYTILINNIAQLYSLNLIELSINIVICVGFILTTLYFLFNSFFRIQFKAISLFLIMLSIVVLFPFFKSDTVQTSQNNLKVAENMQKRMTNLSNNTTNNARLYMWLSAIPWFLDYPLIGSGPDSIRYFYPKYRHPKYALAEGGHNFTPDRLHNEYLNTLVTRGLIGFIVYYVFIIGGWFYLMLRLFNKYYYQEHRFFILALMSGALIYLIQVLFNFGVVATLYVFYLILGLGLSFVNNEQ